MTGLRAVARATARLAAQLESPRERPHHPLDPRHLARAGLVTARLAAETLEGFTRGPAARVAYAELDDKALAFQLFESGSLIESGPGGERLGAAVERALHRYGPDDSVWATEGIGYALGPPVAGASSPAPLRALRPGVPEGRWTVLHTGMGMRLAEAALLLPSTSGRDSLVEPHSALCERLARPGLAALLFEPLGLVARLLAPARLPGLVAELAAAPAPREDLFWHGLGRGLYFLPALAAPARSAPWAGVRHCVEEAPHARAAANALSGFAWAVTLVNLKRPDVVESFIAHHVPDPGHPAARGIASALLLWLEATGGSPAQRRFLRHVAAPALRRAWREVVVRPFESEAAGWPGPARAERVAELFRYREGLVP